MLLQSQAHVAQAGMTTVHQALVRVAQAGLALVAVIQAQAGTPVQALQVIRVAHQAGIKL